jgi:hypothetical protein
MIFKCSWELSSVLLGSNVVRDSVSEYGWEVAWHVAQLEWRLTR